MAKHTTSPKQLKERRMPELTIPEKEKVSQDSFDFNIKIMANSTLTLQNLKTGLIINTTFDNLENILRG